MAEPLTSPLVFIVTLTYNHYDVTYDCLSSASDIDYNPYKIVLVDNASHDDTVASVRADFPHVTVLVNEHNLGVPAGFNVGFEHALRAGADYILMLNNDTVVPKNIISDLLAIAKNDPEAGIIMPRVLYYGTQDKAWSNGGKFRKFPPTILMTRNEYEMPNYPHKIDYAPACCLLIHRQAFEKAGLMDPGYFFFFEDWDFCERVRGEGLNIWFVPSAVIWHKASTTTGSVKSSLFWNTFGASAARFYKRHSSGPCWLWFTLNVGYLYLREFLIKGNWESLPQFHQGVVKGIHTPLSPIPRLSDKG